MDPFSEFPPDPGVLGAKGLSFEVLAEEGSLAPVKTKLSGLSQSEAYMLAWLRNYGDLIADAEREFQVDRRAIAGAIAWEALLNVHSFSARAVGPGKIHTRFTFLDRLINHGSLCEQVELLGYIVPPQGVDRPTYITKPTGAIRYVAAMMKAGAEVAERYGHHIRRSPAILAYFYNTKNLATWENHLQSKHPGAKLVPPSDYTEMSAWVAVHDDFLVDAVGATQIPIQP